MTSAAPITPAQGQAQQTEAAQRCFERHQFGAQPVDVAKTADGQTVLAQTSWNWHDTIGCYLTLDDAAVAVLRVAPPPQNLPGQPTDASRRCFEHHKFGTQPVDVAKTADGQTVLARLLWNRHATIGCYLTLDNTALSTLRAAHLTPEPEPEPTEQQTPEPEPEPTEQQTPAKYTAIATGSKHSCAIKTDQTIACWGDSANGKLDAPRGQFTSISVGWWHSCAIRTDQTIACWGYNEHGPTDAPSGRFTAISAGNLHSCGIKTDQTIACWGRNHKKQADAPAGQFTAVSAGSWYTCAIKTDDTISCWGDTAYSLGGQYTAIAAGGFSTASSSIRHSCAIQADQTIACWGQNTYGQLGEPAGQYTAISAGDAHSCAIKTDQTIACWGRNRDGHRCVITTDHEYNCWDDNRYSAPHAEVPTGRFTAISAGSWHSCAIRTDQTIACWGDDRYGQTGPTTDSRELTPGGQHTAIAAGWGHTCAIKADQSIICWGKNDYAQLNAPDGQYTAIATGSTHSCAIRTDLTITCWGNNTFSQADPPPGQYTAIAAGLRHSCAIKTDHTIACWGDNQFTASTPQAVAPPGQYTAIAAGLRHSCAIKTDQTITCWGYDYGVQDLFNPPPGQYTAIATQSQHGCAIKTDNTIACWGDDYGAQDLFKPPPGQYTAIAAGSQYICAIRINQTIACWGVEFSYDGVLEPPSGQFIAISAGDSHACAIKIDQTITCWGSNDSSPEDSAAPTDINAAIATGLDHSCTIKTDQTIDCWGNNDRAQADPPRGQYTAIAAGGGHTCAIRAKRVTSTPTISQPSNLKCWGRNYWGQADPPAGTYTAIATGLDHSCAINIHQTITCWGSNDDGWGNYTGQADAPPGRYIAIAAGETHSCAIRTDQTIDCWGYDDIGKLDAPPGHYTAISTSWWHSCAIKTDQTITCWGDNGFGQATPPPGRYIAIAAGDTHSCAIKTDQTIVCWGANNLGRIKDPNSDRDISGKVISISDYGQAYPPAGQYRSVAANEQFSCALRIDNTIVCWGRNDRNQADPTSGPYIHDQNTQADADTDHFVNSSISADSWWHQPRGLLRVKIHVCTTPKLRPFIPAQFIDNHVAALNDRVAPYYDWQSSGLLNLRFEAGQVLETPYRYVEDGNWSEDCVRQVHDYSESVGLIHHFLEYGTGVANGSPYGGKGMLSGPLSSTFIRHEPDDPPAAPYEGSTSLLQSPFGGVLPTVAHEVDHNIGIHHLNGVPLGATRISVDEVTLTEGERSDNPAFSEVYPCYERTLLGWPVGEGRPICARIPPLPPRTLEVLEDDDGVPTLSWLRPFDHLNSEPITGYKIRLVRFGAVETSSYFADTERTEIAQYEVDANITEISLPQQLPPGRYGVVVVAKTDAGDTDENYLYFSTLGGVRIHPRDPRQLQPQYTFSWDPDPNALYYVIVFPGGNCFASFSILAGCYSIPTDSSEPQMVLHEDQLARPFINDDDPGKLIEGITYTIRVYAVIATNETDPYGRDLFLEVGTLQFTASRRNVFEWYRGPGPGRLPPL